MTRDWDLIREILAKLEELPDTRSKLMPRQVTGWTEDAVSYHIWLLIQSGMIEGKCNSSPGGNAGMHCHGTALTWQGHEFLASVRTDTAWNAIKTKLGEKAIDLSFEAIKAAALAILSGM